MFYLRSELSNRDVSDSEHISFIAQVPVEATNLRIIATSVELVTASLFHVIDVTQNEGKVTSCKLNRNILKKVFSWAYYMIKSFTK